MFLDRRTTHPTTRTAWTALTESKHLLMASPSKLTLSPPSTATTKSSSTTSTYSTEPLPKLETDSRSALLKSTFISTPTPLSMILVSASKSSTVTSQPTMLPTSHTLEESSTRRNSHQRLNKLTVIHC